MSAEIILETKGLRAGYGRIPVLHGIDLAVGEGEVVGILGHNGMGKTTLLKALIGLVPATGGSIHFQGIDITKEPPHARNQLGIGYVPQGRGVFPMLSARDNLRIAVAAHGEDEDEALNVILHEFPRLEPLLDRVGSALSGGEQQLLAIARCLVSEPRLVLLDEPTEGIQPSIVDEIIDVLRSLGTARGISIVLVEQNLEFITALSDRVLLLQKGLITGEISGSHAADPALVDEFIGFGGRTDTAARPRPAPPSAPSKPAPPSPARHPQPIAASAPPPAMALSAAATPSYAARHSAEPQRSMSPAMSTNQYPTSNGGRPLSAGVSSSASRPSNSGNGAYAQSGSRAAGARAGSAAPEPMAFHPQGYKTVKRPTHSQLAEIVEEFGMHMSDARIDEFLTVMEDYIGAYDIVDAMPDYLPPVDYPRTAGYRPSEDENPLNAWYVKTEIRGAPRGPLSGRTVALKDNVCLAGVPMMNGASTLKGYTPDVDATVVTRLLDAGATIMGKAHCEYFCLSGGSHTNATGPVQNPRKHGYSAGGSSSGSGALVASGEVDMAIGGDQGGSIRMPSAFCGCYGMKPTHGLVPYTGVMPIETTIDHTGPITANVADNALMLEAIAGEDGLDPRQYSPQVDNYTAALGRGASRLRIGVVKEGFGHDNSEADVDAKVREAAAKFRALGATVDEISIPMHLAGAAIWTPIAVEGLTNQMMKGNGMGTGWKGLYTTSLLDYHANWRTRADELSDSLKVCMFIGEYYLKHHRGHYYAKSQNLGRKLRAAYDAMLGAYDLLLMPTLPMKATPLPPPDASLALYVQRAFEMVTNTSPFDVTGHPAMSVPCGMSDGLPVGMMLIARHWQEATIYQAAHAFEQSGDWLQM
jgi:amidase